MVRRVRSTLPFYGEVYGQDISKMTPLEAKNVQEEALSNSRPLSHWTILMVRPNYVETMSFFNKLGKVSDFTHKEKVHTK
jgi:hypothetical protein